ncbi:hypothetical protein K5Y78_005221, partial [Escherichia coli]|nr:hypothetical protein [Escherichia coli]
VTHNIELVAAVYDHRSIWCFYDVGKSAILNVGYRHFTLINSGVGHNDRGKEQQSEWDGLHAATSLITSNAELNTSTIAKAFMTTSFTGEKTLRMTPVKMQSMTKAIETMSNKYSI